MFVHLPEFELNNIRFQRTTEKTQEEIKQKISVINHWLKCLTQHAIHRKHQGTI